MTRRFIFSTFAYFFITMLIAYPWHMVWFKDVYHQLGIYTREEPIMAFGMLAIIIQGSVISYLFPQLIKGDNPIKEGIRINLILGLMVYSCMAFANVAKLEVTSITTFLFYHTSFQLMQFVATGMALGLIYKK